MDGLVVQAMAALDAWAITWGGEGSIGLPYLEAVLQVPSPPPPLRHVPVDVLVHVPLCVADSAGPKMLRRTMR